MLLDQLKTTHIHIKHILRVLRENHSFDFPIKNPSAWPQLLEHYNQVQEDIQNQHQFNSYNSDPLYAKAVLITEAVRMLIEIAPRRMRKKVKESQDPQDHIMTNLNEKAKKAKPDFLDVDGDGDTDESFKKAVKDKKKAHKISEKWDAEMQTKPADKGKWDGFTIAELKARKKKLMDKESRSAAEQKEVRQINFAIRAKQKDSWGKIKSESALMEDANLDQAETLLAAKDMSDSLQGMAENVAKMSVDRLMPLVDTMKGQFGQPAAEGFNQVMKTHLQTVLDAIIDAKDATDDAIMSLQSGSTPAAQAPDISAELPATPAATDQEPAAPDQIDFEKEFAATPSASGPEAEPLGRAKKERTDEAKKTPKRNPYAIGMAQAKKEMGFSAAPAKDLPKKVIVRAHEIARSIEDTKESQQLEEADQKLRSLMHNYKLLEQQLVQHEAQFRSSGAPDPLGLGRGLEGDRIYNHMKKVVTQIRETKKQRDHLRVALHEQAAMISETQKRIQRLEEQAATTGYGVVGVTHQGERVKQFFESAALRDMWLDYNTDNLKQHSLIDPDRLTSVSAKLSRTISK